MKSRFSMCITAMTLLVALAIPVGLAAQQQQQEQVPTAPTFKALYRFAGGADGGTPKEDFLLRDHVGNLYGTTEAGGTSNYGVIYKLSPTGKESVLYTFTGGVDGGNPYGGLVRDAAGNLYGTTCCGGGSLAGVVYELDKTGKENVLYTFTERQDGGYPYAGLIRDDKGNLYGAGTGGGQYNPAGGVVFKVDPTTGKETVLYSFTGGTDGGTPGTALLRDNAGNLYGATTYGGSSACTGGNGGCGVVFKVNPTTGKETVLYSFTGGTDGANPFAGLLRDAAGNIYGTTLFGGQYGWGVVFKLDKTTAKESVLHSFTGGADGGFPYATLVRDKVGNLYGTTYGGGNTSGLCSAYEGCGVVFKLDEHGKETVLYTFTGGGDGFAPRGRLLRDAAGALYGTTASGGFNGCGGLGCGVVFKVTP